MENRQERYSIIADRFLCQQQSESFDPWWHANTGDSVLHRSSVDRYRMRGARKMLMLKFFS